MLILLLHLHLQVQILNKALLCKPLVGQFALLKQSLLQIEDLYKSEVRRFVSMHLLALAHKGPLWVNALYVQTERASLKNPLWASAYFC